MFDTVKLLRMKHCGELNFMCCVQSVEQLKELARLLDGASKDDLEFLYKMICSCSITTTTGGKTPGVPPGTSSEPGDVCIKKLRDAICKEWVTDAVSIAQLGLTAAGALANINPKLKRVVIGCAAALAAFEAACASETLDLTVVHGLCSVVEKLKEWKTLTGVVMVCLLPVMGLFGLLGATGAGVAINECCSNPKVASAALPDWATALDSRASNDTDDGLATV